MAPPKKKFYVVAAGRTPGIYTSWPQAEAQVKGFSKAKFKGFATHEAAQDYWQTFGSNNRNGGGGGGGGANTGTIGIAVAAPAAGAPVQKAGKRSASLSGFTHFAAAASASGFSTDNDNNNRGGGKRSRLEKREERKMASSSLLSSISISQSTKNNDQLHNDALGSQRLEFDIYFDGGARGNPGVAGAGTHIVEKQVDITTTVRKGTSTYSSGDDVQGNTFHRAVTTERSKTDIRTYLGSNSTNNQAEYTGAIGGLRHVLETLQKHLKLFHGDTNNPSVGSIKVSLKGDSNLVIQHLLGSWSCKSPKLVPLLRQAQGLVQDLKALAKASNVTLDVTFGHVYREDNKIADALANEAMDERQSRTTTSADMEFHALGGKDEKADIEAQKQGCGDDSDKAYV